ncbi:acyl-CoA dehydrogenase [Alteromonas oceanisediminis]|uniref:acyl-CoA dehydrogenase n=1 Tax=Alteromonas oceanisediminis TaxID=2836180 RepID=UPI001BDAC25D|nr:acyl-CoA dehydrogenase [Alteromonas oceanisediminis]MBT0586393.1 acyl-CoA dehydrogenase C-terminal domain-containing protein [Alteromonas oceanisediminis]
MANQLVPRQELEFQLYHALNTHELIDRDYFADHSTDTFNAVLDTAEKIAEELFLPHNATADKHEPTFDGSKVTMLDDVKRAFDAYREAGFIAGRYKFEDGGMQLPETVMTACASYFMAANPSTTAYPFLTAAAANVIAHFATDELKAQFMPRMLSGEFTGTMALTEPHAGSSLADIRTTAVKQVDGSFRIKGSKIYISGGEHELSDNIVHLVLAKIPGGPGGVKGISLFVVPKYRLQDDGSIGQKNDISLAGLIHKLGYRGTTSTALTFGENDDCHGYLVGEAHHGLRYMFKMMNEARIGVGFGAAMIGYRGYRYSLEYAKDRTQGRKAPNTAPSDSAVPIIEHGDVKRMLLAQKAYSEGGMALCFYGARLVDDLTTLSEGEEKQATQELLDLLTPVCKAWPSEFGPKANDLAIQVLGGAGYTREYPVEQCWRDNRLNPIHEGTNGIQALDLMARKLWQSQGLGLRTLQQRVEIDLAKATSTRTRALVAKLTPYLGQLQSIIGHIGKTLQGDQQAAQLANAQCFMNVFSSIVMSWVWIRQAIAAEAMESTQNGSDHSAFIQGKLAAAEYYIHWELPLVQRDLSLLETIDPTCDTMQPDWF